MALLEDGSILFDSFVESLIGVPVSHVWRGYGSAIFLEFGELHPGSRRTDGSEGNPLGDWTLAIEWGWRIEGKRYIWCGSWSDSKRWPRFLSRLQGAKVHSISIFGRLPEVCLSLSNGLRLLSMMTSEGDPSWWLTRRADGISRSISVHAGRLRLQTDR